MTAFATASDLASILQRDTIDTYTANLLLNGAADAIRNEVGLQIDLLTTTETYDPPPIANWWEPPPADSALLLRERQVTAVTSIVENGVALVSNVDYIWKRSGEVIRIVANQPKSLKQWDQTPQGIVVTYTHGFDVTTKEFGIAKLVNLQAAARAYVNPEYIQSQSIGQYQIRYGRIGSLNIDAAGPIQLTPYEKEMLQPLQRTLL